MSEGHTSLRKRLRLRRPKKPDCSWAKVRGWLSKPDNLQVTLMIIAVILGLVIGFSIKLTMGTINSRAVLIISYPGELLMNMLKMLIIPLIVSSLISGLANLDMKSCGKIGSWALGYYFVTTLMAVILGIVLVVAIHPGSANIKKQRGAGTLEAGRKPDTLDAFLDLFRNLFPENIIKSCTHQVSSRFVNKSFVPDVVKLNDTSVEPYNEEVLEQHFIEGTNVLGLVTFSIAFGICIGHMGEKGKLMLDFFNIMNEIIMRLVGLIMWYAPVGILFLVIGKILGIDDLAEAAGGLGLYMVTVITGLFIHLFVTLALLYYIVTRRNPFTFFKGMLQAFFTALGTGSSSATLPVTFRCLEEKLDVDPRVTKFVLPIGATVNMDGTALYEAVASIFIAQLNSYELGITQLMTISLTATLAAIGAASVPSAGLVTMILVLTSVGLPSNDITLILAVDWMLDRLRTAVNVMGDSYGAGIVAHLCRVELAKARELDRLKLPAEQANMEDYEDVGKHLETIEVTAGEEPYVLSSLAGQANMEDSEDV